MSEMFLLLLGEVTLDMLESKAPWTTDNATVLLQSSNTAVISGPLSLSAV